MSTPPAFLTLPSGRKETHLERRRRRASPSPRAEDPTNFCFPTPSSTMDADAIRALVESTVKAATESAVQASLQATQLQLQAQQQTQSTAEVTQSLSDVRIVTRKPEIPNFDKHNLEIWIKRTEAALTRANVTCAKEKFAQMELKFDCNVDVTINDFLYNTTPTDETWRQFLDHLRHLYGRTRKQEATSLINGTPRDGKRPTAHYALMLEKAGKATIDDILKEHLLNGLPLEVKRQLSGKVENMSAKEVAKMADDFFDKEGRMLHSTPATDVNHVNASSNHSHSSSSSAPTAPQPFTEPFPTDEETDVNAVRFRQGQRQHFNINNRSGNPRSRGGSNFRGRGSHNNNNNNNNNRGSNPSGQNKVCYFHNKFGEETRRCEAPCILNKQFEASKGKPSQRT